MSDIITLDPMTSAEAIKTLRKLRKGRVIFIRAGTWLPTTEGRGFESCVTVRVSFDIAVKYIKDALRTFDERGAKLRLAHSDRCIFVG